MKKFKLSLLAILTAVLLVGCNQDDDNNNNGNNSNNTFSENFGNSVSRDFAGQVVDVNGLPVGNATVSIGASSTQTDLNGIFMINGASVKEKFAFIQVEKPGFVDGSRTMVPTSGLNNAKIMLIPQTPIESIQSGQSSTVSLPSGTQVKFDGAFEDANGNSYSGAVSVSMYHLESSNENISQLMPGSLYAEDDNGDEAILQTYGMLNVELRVGNGEKLQIAEGHAAEISMMIDDSQLTSAPATIPLWHFDEELGYWKEEGFATKVGNMYKGEVTHFSWWNVDFPYETSLLTINVVDNDGNPLPNFTVSLEFLGFHVSGLTDSNGQLSGYVPVNTQISLHIEQYGLCGQNSVYNGQIGPFTTDTVLPNIVLSNSNVVVISGTVLQCDNSPVTNGYVLLRYNNLLSGVAYVSDGAFSFPYGTCGVSDDNQFTLEGFDYNNLQTTGSITYTMIAPATAVGPILACTQVNEYLTYQIDNDSVQTFVSGFNVSGFTNNEPGFSISGFGSQQQNIYLISNVNSVGTYNTNNFTITGDGIYLGPNLPNNVQMNLNQFGGVGEYIDLTITGTYTDATGVRTISGVAHVIRDN